MWELNNINSSYVHITFYCLFRVLRYLVLIPFIEGTRNPNGTETQQKAETATESVFGKASSTIGMMVGLNRAVAYLCNTRSREIAQKLAMKCPT